MDDDTVPCVVSPRFMVGSMDGAILTTTVHGLLGTAEELARYATPVMS